MADITIFKPAAVTVEVIDGNPPVDQSAEVAALTAQVAALQAALDAANAKWDPLESTCRHASLSIL